MTARLLLGDEAVAMAAVDAGIGGAFSYAGTPATEIFESIQAMAPDVWAEWSANEKVAYEEALGMSYAGKRALVSMKHVGLNVASDPFMSSALTGVNGGLVLVVADDPGMHSSQNEQDSRFYAEFAHLPCFEPSTQQECYDMTRDAFRLSEEWGVPVMVRLVTRLAHSRSGVHQWPEDERARRETALPLPNPNDWTLVPINARRRYRHLLDLQPALRAASETSPYNTLELGGKRGVICAGTGSNYVREMLGAEPEDSLLRIGLYPLPEALIRKLVQHCDEIVVVEEGYPFIEQRLNGLLGLSGKDVRGKLDGSLPPDGELLPETVARALGVPLAEGAPEDPIVAGRPPQFCKGCPHSDTFNAMLDATREFPHALMFGDIGCYALGIMPPYQAVHSCVDMGSSVGMAHGARRAGAYPVLCAIGDSTFAHSGMSALLGAVHSDADITVLILDNATTAMTGAQDSMATGEPLLEILRGLGVKDLHLVEPLPKHRAENVEVLRKAIDHKGLSVIVARRACIQIRPSKRSSNLPVE
ncbi:MAG: thiamine pyrophosphate-dependent enzyme [Fimbriimonadaceae bacterium]|nr:indolepyruvate ferredoxin oxidoreductase [Chthonomonadaceae bacterium]MCO5297234.1 thiamine pyrophosphate-dependent enzyme [Fimbriimonadaceae bacterium]